MANGPGYLDPEGVWQFGEDDEDTLMSDLLNLGQDSISQAFVLDRARLADLEEVAIGALLPFDAGVTINSLTDLSRTASGHVVLNFQAHRAAGFNTNTGIGVLPAGFRPSAPKQPIYFIGLTFGSGTPAAVQINSLGHVALVSPAVAGHTVAAGSVVFRGAS